jgi:hypothetical protein
VKYSFVFDPDEVDPLASKVEDNGDIDDAVKDDESDHVPPVHCLGFYILDLVREGHHEH